MHNLTFTTDVATRAAMLATGMEHGIEDSYVRLELMI